MASRQPPKFVFLLLLIVTIGSLVAVTFADDILDGELPLDGDSAPPSLPSESFGDVIGAGGDADDGPTGSPAGSPVEDGGMGPTGSDENNVSGSPVDGGDADGGSDAGSPPTSTPAAKEEKSPSGASTVGIGASIVTAFVGFLAF